jgi:hypothetical protein
MTVGELLDKVSSSEITEWQAFFYLEEEERKHEENKAKAKRGR